ncbi:MAG: ABC transporter permease [Acidobacteriaceae bacterium]|nr:ABC transporter permease [Acidobacteriaceae bacterium]
MSWKRFFRRRYWDREREREIAAYIEFETADNIERGMSAEEARYAALRKLGNTTLIREEIYNMNSIGILEVLWQDLRYGARGLRLSPGFTTVAVLSLALGIGANTAIFQLLDAVRLRLLPVKDPQQLVEVSIINRHHRTGSATGRRSSLTNPQWEQIRDRQQVFSRVAAWGDKTFNTAPGGEAQNVEGLLVSGDFFNTLGVPAVLGRVFTSTDDRRGCGSSGAVISYTFWQRKFGGNAGALGRKLTLNGHPFEVIGITPPSFFGVDVGQRFDVAVPICSEPLLEPDMNSLDKRHYWWLAAIGRLKPGISAEQAQAQLKAISPAVFQSTIPSTYDSGDVRNYLTFRLGATPAGSGVSSIRGTVETPLILLLSIAGLVLLIACANLANLMLARASVREREIAVRLALGASRPRLIFQLLSESLLLAFTGATLGVVLAQVLSRLLVLFMSGSNPSVFLELSPDWRVLGFTAALALLTCVLFGLTPALRATKTSTSAAMKTGGRGMTASHERFGLRRLLVVLQVAFSLVLLVSALLFVRSLTNLLTLDAGFQQDEILITDLDMTRFGFSSDRQRATNQDILERIRRVPGVESAAIVENPPVIGGTWNERVFLEGRENQRETIYFNCVSDDYFKTLNISRLAGRDFNSSDTPASPKVAIVNEAFARKFTGGANPIGKHFRIQGNPGAPEPFYQIIGLVKSSKYRNMREEFIPVIFKSESQIEEPDNDPSILIRFNTSFSALTSSIKRVINDVNPSITLSFKIFKASIREGLLVERLMATLSSFFGFLAVTLATVGLYGVIAYMVTRRRNEIGIRMALGADRPAVVRMVIREAVVLLSIGLLIGTVLALFAARAANSLLFGLKSWDPTSLMIAIAALASITLIASYVPALRAARLDPMTALREE